MALTHGSLFTGIGGFDLASQWAGFENIFQVEIDPFCQKVLQKNFPNTKKYLDIKEFDGTKYKGRVDIIPGGFPCQPFSIAGKRKGEEDDRYLWDEMLRVIREIKPKYIVGENVTGILNMGFESILFELEAEGYITETFVIPAAAISAPHQRKRIWITAYLNDSKQKYLRGKSENNDWSEEKEKLQKRYDLQRTLISNKIFADSNFARCKSSMQYIYYRETKNIDESPWNKHWYEVATKFCRVDDGVPNRMDRLKSLGNAIVPQIAYIIFEAIKELEIND